MSDQTESAAPALPTPVIAESDGWSVVSASVGPRLAETAESRPTPESVAAELAEGEPPPAPDAESDAPPVEAKPPAAKPPEPKKILTATERKAEIQAQINAAWRERSEARAAVDAERAELAKLKAERERVAARPPETPPAPSSDTRPTWKQYEAEGRSWDDYADAHDAWFTAQRDRERVEVRAEAERVIEARLAEQARARETHDRTMAAAQIDDARRARMAAATEKYPDFQEVAQNLGDLESQFLQTAITLHPKGPELLYWLGQHPDEAKTLAELPLPVMVMDAVAESDDPVPLLAYFAQHPAEVTRFQRMPPRSALVALGALTTRLVLEGANTGSPERPSVTRAPAPIRPIGGTRTSGPPRSLDEIPFEQYVTTVNREESKRGRL